MEEEKDDFPEPRPKRLWLMPWHWTRDEWWMAAGLWWLSLMLLLLLAFTVGGVTWH